MIRKSLLIINFSESVGLELTYSLANKRFDLLLNGEYDIDKRSDLVKSISKLGVKCFHHGADILDPKELDILLQDTRRQLDDVDIVLILISSKDYKPLFSVFDKSLSMLNERNNGKLINLLFFENSETLLNIKKDIDVYCNKILEDFSNLEYSSIQYQSSMSIDELASIILNN
jgi:hypothetical protein